jgi:hypothetical protein
VVHLFLFFQMKIRDTVNVVHIIRNMSERCITVRCVWNNTTPGRVCEYDIVLINILLIWFLGCDKRRSYGHTIIQLRQVCLWPEVILVIGVEVTHLEEAFLACDLARSFRAKLPFLLILTWLRLCDVMRMNVFP